MHLQKSEHMKKQTNQPQRVVKNTKVTKNLQKNFSDFESSVKSVYNMKTQIMIYLIFIISGFILYSNSIPFGYTFDDKIVVTRNEFTKKGIAGIGDILSNDSFTSYFGKMQNLVSGGRYRPLPVITFALEYELWMRIRGTQDGENPHFSHVINILLYALNAIILFIILTKLLLTKENQNRDKQQIFSQHWYMSIPFLATILFMYHPIHTEVVANIKGRDEMLVFLFSLLTLWSTLRYLESDKIKYLIISGFTFFLGLLSKENSIMFWVIIPLCVYYFTHYSFSKTIKSLIPLLPATIIFMVIRNKVLGGFTTEPLPELMNNPFLLAVGDQKFATIFYTWGVYIKLLIYPNTLTYDYYPYHIELVHLTDWRSFTSLFLYLGMGIYALIKIRKKTILSFAIWYYLVNFSIISNFFFPIGAFMNERFIYVGSLGFTLALAYFLSQKLPILLGNLSQQAKSGIMLSILMLLLVPYTLKIIDRNKVWENDYTLFTTDVQTSKGSAFGNLTAGKQFLFKAERIRDTMLKYNHQKDTAEMNKYFRLGIFHLTNATTIHPKYVNGLFFLSQAHYEYNQNFQAAIAALERLVVLTPDNDEVWYRLGSLYTRHTNQIQKGVEYMETALKYNPQNLSAISNLGAIYFNTNQVQKSLNMFLTFNQLQPNNPEVLGNIAYAYEALGNKAEAQKYQAMANAIKGGQK